MTKLVLQDIASGHSLSKINQNFTDIEEEFQNKVLYRNNPESEPNTMETALDMNSKRILNLPAPISDNEPVRLGDIGGITIEMLEEASADIELILSIGDSVAQDSAAAVAAADAAIAAAEEAVEAAEALGGINLEGTTATSSSTLIIGLGTKILTIPAGKALVEGMTVKIAMTSSPTNWMLGDIITYVGTTLTVAVNNTQGSGTAAAWTISLSGVNATFESIGAAESGANSNITSLSGLTTPLSIDQGGSGYETGATEKIQSITASLATSAMTVTLAATTLDFRSATLTSGAAVTRTVATPISVIVPSGATLGTTSGASSDILVLAIDNAGTVELAVVNVLNGTNYSEAGLISTTAITTGADSSDVVYSTAARTNVPYRVVGFVRSTQATAGTWATTLTLVQGAGGKALEAYNVLTSVRKQKFTGNGTWVCPVGITTAYVSGIGCGGGGGGSGASPAAGTNATDSTFDSLVTLAGGHGGAGGGISAVALGGISGSGRGFRGGDGIGLSMSGTGGGKGGGNGTSTHLGSGGDAASQTGGGGGGGGLASGSYVPSAGGGSGEIADFKSISVTPGVSYTVTIGAIGTGGNGGSTTGGNGATGYFIVEW